MKKTRRKNVLRGIRSSLNRFLSILFIVALGSGFLAGLFATSPDMYETADAYMDEYRLYDISIKSALGFTEDDVSSLKALGNFETVQPAKVMDMVMVDEHGSAYTSRVFAILDENGETDINCLKYIDGRAPQNSGECVLQNAVGQYSVDSPQIGETISISPENQNIAVLRESVKGETLTIVGIVESPMCMGIEGETTNIGSGSIAMDVYTTEDFFTIEPYTDIYAAVRGAAALDSFGNEYGALISSATAEAESAGEERAAIREEELKKQAEALLAAMQSAGADLDSSLAQTLPSIPKTGDGQWIIRTRGDAVGYSSYKSNVGKVSALSKIFPVFFFVVALLVALTTMTRLVEENRCQIGTLKALGFSDGQILSEYMLYSLLSSLLGCALGFAVGFKLFPAAISSAYGMLYTMPETVTPFRFNIAVLVAPVTIISILLATLWACYGEFRACPAALMIPKAPAAGKRIWLEHIGFVWKRLSFTRKVTCRNLFRYKKRFLMTVIGVAGCSALLVTGFGLRDSINDIVDKQFGEIYKYELTVLTNSENAAEEDEALSAFLSGEAVTNWLKYSDEKGKLTSGGKSSNLSICVPNEVSRFGEFVSLRERKSQKPVELQTYGAVLTEKLCEELGVKAGDTVTLENEAGRRGSVEITGITENYITSFAYMSPEAYEETFGEVHEADMLLCCIAAQADSEELTAGALESESVIYARSSRSIKDTFSDNIKSIDAVIVVLILAAGLLCVVVLYNLTNVNICERRKELATISVLGFHESEVERYIFRETNVLSFLGALVGLAVGVWLHSFVVRTVEVDQVMFGRTIYPLSFVYALAISVIFTFIVNQIMKRQIRKVDMVEAMKAND